MVLQETVKISNILVNEDSIVVTFRGRSPLQLAPEALSQEDIDLLLEYRFMLQYALTLSDEGEFEGIESIEENPKIRIPNRRLAV